MENKVTFRNAERKDTGLILQFVKELAAYEDMSDDVIADESILETWIFDKQKAEVLFAVVDGTVLHCSSITFLPFLDGQAFI